MNRRVQFVVALPFALLPFAACGGGGSSTTGGTGTPPTTLAPSPTPSATPPLGAASCPLGKGTTDTTCYKASVTFLEQVDEDAGLSVYDTGVVQNITKQAYWHVSSCKPGT